MRRLTLLFAGGAVWLFLAAIPVFADGGPHVANINNGTKGLNADSCSGCHRAHTAQASLLLVQDQPALCFSCHGGAGNGATTDVQNGVQYSLGTTHTTDVNAGASAGVVGALRNGGFANARIDSGNAARLTYAVGSDGSPSLVGMVPASTGGRPVTSSHLINGSTGIAWGNSTNPSTFYPSPAFNLGATVQLECTSCHNPHGNNNYRILNPVPTVAATTGLPVFINATSGVYVPDDTTNTGYGDGTRNYTIIQASGGTTLTLKQVVALSLPVTAGDYFHRKVPWTSQASSSTSAVWDQPNGLPAQFNPQMNLWCSQCHTRILATGSKPYSNSSTDAVFTYRHSNTSNKPCTTCHVAHGSNASMYQITGPYTNPFQIVPGTTGAAVATTTTTDSFLLKVDNRGTCQLCHDPSKTGVLNQYIGPNPTPRVP